MKRLRAKAPILILLVFITAAVIYLPLLKSTLHKGGITLKRANREWFKLISRHPEEGPEFEKWYFNYWHQPYGHQLGRKALSEIWKNLKNMPAENFSLKPKGNSIQSLSSSGGWKLLGPSGLLSTSDLPGKVYNSGRLLDVETSRDNSYIRLASASGGLWQLNLNDNSIIPLSDNLSSLAAGSFASKPDDPNTIFIGTGEPGVRTGTGLWKTANGGSTWDSVPLPTVPDAFYKIRYARNNSEKINAASTDGLFNSIDGGDTFKLTLPGDVTDFCEAPDNPDVIYACIRYEGLFKSADGGLSWSRLSIPGILSSSYGRTSVSVYSSGILYTAVSNAATNGLTGIYKSTDGGVSWFKKEVPFNYLEQQAWYDNFISVCPSDPDLIFAGGASLLRSEDDGNTWEAIKSGSVHPDHHSLAWMNDGSTILECNDGGLTISSDKGNNWTTKLNRLPVTQYVNISVGREDPGVIFGGSQDNGISGTSNGGNSWFQTYDGDGGGVTVDKSNASEIFGSDGVFADGRRFHFLESPDYGAHWHEIDNGIAPSDQWYTSIREYKDQYKTVLYAASGYYVYYSYNNGANWNKLNPETFNSTAVGNFSVSPTSPGGTPIVYACMEDIYGVNILKVFDEGVWHERSAGLPKDYFIRKIVPDPKDYNSAYALINGFSSQKIFKTTNRGITWLDITGKLPDIPVADLIVNPMDNNKLYLGTEMGCFETADGGTTWVRWNNGLPESAIITEMKSIDSIAVNGKFYVVAGTFGRSIWIREIDNAGPKAEGNNKPLSADFELLQNYPNPFNPSTTIRFSVPRAGYTLLKVYDLSGKEIGTLVNGILNAGFHEVNFSAGSLASGIYLYKLSIDSYSLVKKMILLR